MGKNDFLDEVHVRILRVTEDLRAIQQTLNCAAMQAPGDPELMEALCQLPEIESLQVLRSALDQMRHFLWFYMQVMTNESESGERLRQSIRQKVSADAVVIAFVGTFGLWHGAPVLAAAIKQLVDNERRWLEETNIRFAMIGDGVRMKEVRELIGGAEYSEWVVFTGLVPQADTVQYLAAADILVSPHISNGDGTRFFGSPTKLFEYMAMAKGIVASDLDQIGEVLSAGIRIWDPEARKEPGNTSATAVLTRPGEIGDLIDGLKLLVERPGLRRQLGVNARSELLRRYTWPHHVAHILETMRGETSKETANAAIAEPAR